MSRIKEPFDLYSIADVVEKNYEFCHSATRVFVSLFCFFIFFFHFLRLARQTGPRKGETARTLEDCLCRRFDGSSSVCVLMFFFPFSIFLILFRGWHDILKEIEESSSRHGSAVTSSRRGSVTGYFLNRSIFGDFFSICGGRDNFVISLPSSTTYFNWIPHEFSVLLASCLFIKLQTAAHVFFINTLGTTHFNTLVSFVFP